MKRPSDFAINGLRLVAVTLLTAWVLMPAPAQQGQAYHVGVVSDWTDRHVIFSDPGTLQDAMMNGRRQEWERIVNDPRYRMQQIRRRAAFSEQTTIPRLRFPGPPGPPEGGPSFPIFGNGGRGRKSSLQGDWAVTLGSSLNSVAIGKYPAKFSFAPIGTPDCTNDFVVFPINAVPATNQANILGVNNLYVGTCTGTVPSAKFAYSVGTGPIQTSPVLSLSGTKVAFVETVTNGSVFHVLTLGTTGSNGTVFNSPAVPGTGNNASDKAIKMSGNVTDSSSGPFVDYTNDVAYVGDDNGNIHKFTGVFNGTPAEAGAPWPVAAAVSASSAPVYDSVSQHIFFGTGNGNIRCVVAATAADCGNGAVSVAGGTAGSITTVADSPIVDSTHGTVFAAASNNANSVLFQANTTLGSPVRTTMGINGTDLYDGAFDNAYFTSVSTGHMYFCGNLANAATPTLYRVGFNSSGIMNATKDAGSFQLVQANQTGTANDCTPLTEAFNATKDRLFLGVKNNGNPTGCNGNTCIMSFNLGSTFPVPIAATTTNHLGAGGMSAFIIDNVSGAAGASQIYYGSLQTSVGVQVSESALQ